MKLDSSGSFGNVGGRKPPFFDGDDDEDAADDIVGSFSVSSLSPDDDPRKRRGL